MSTPRWRRIDPDVIFFFSLDHRARTFAVRAGDGALVVFDESGNHLGTGAPGPDGSFLMFDRAQRWIGYLIPDGQGGYVHFDHTSQWIGYAV